MSKPAPGSKYTPPTFVSQRQVMAEILCSVNRYQPRKGPRFAHCDDVDLAPCTIGGPLRELTYPAFEITRDGRRIQHVTPPTRSFLQETN